MSEERAQALEMRVAALEARLAAIEKTPEDHRMAETIKRIVDKWPVMMKKTEAAKILGVTRTTIYTMIWDKRLEETATGKISTQSVIDLIKGPIVKKRGPKKTA